jgi:hypothetical protein
MVSVMGRHDATCAWTAACKLDISSAALVPLPDTSPSAMTSRPSWQRMKS